MRSFKIDCLFHDLIKVLIIYPYKYFFIFAGFIFRFGSQHQPFFIFADTPVPAWWTQYPKKAPLLTGWLSGPVTANYKDQSENEILAIAIESLALIFNMDASALKTKLKYYIIRNWLVETFSNGAYSYPTLMQKNAANTLRMPIEGTIYFAGEAVATETTGTVDAALLSGKYAAEKIIKLQ